MKETGCKTVSRRELHQLLAAAAAQAKPARPLTLLLWKLKDFNLWQERLTPLACDRLLDTVGELIARAAPAKAVYCYWGGDKFALLLPDCREGEADFLGRQVAAQVGGYRPAGYLGSLASSIELSFAWAVYPATPFLRLGITAEKKLKRPS